jgi:hypothetical protein
MGRVLTRARDTAWAKDGSGFRRAIGLAGVGVLAFARTTAITTYVGKQAIP